MKVMITLLMVLLPAMSIAQAQSGAASGLPSAAIPKTTAVLVIQTPKQGVTFQQVMAVIPDEIQATVRLYLDGKIREWYSRGNGKGVIFLVDVKTEDEARALMETLPLAKSTVNGHRIHSRRAINGTEDVESRCISVRPRRSAPRDRRTVRVRDQRKQFASHRS